jgi:hypothetical protein
MSNLIFYTIIIFTGTCVVLAVFVWLQARTINKPEQKKSELYGKPVDALVMRPGDWFNAVINVVMGVLLGILIDCLVQLISTDLWPAAVLIVVLAAVLMFLDSWIDVLFDKVFSSGIRPAHKLKKVRKAPMVRRLSLPSGLVLGVVLAGLGLGDRVLGWLY